MRSSIVSIIIAFNCAIFAFESISSDIYFSVKFGLNLLFFNGFYIQPLTYMFLHGSFLHLVMNMAVLYGIGSDLERHLGSLKFGLLYITGGIFAGFISLAYIYFLVHYFSDNHVSTVGASGAICALLGFIAYFNKSKRVGLLLVVILMSVLPNVAWYAHLAGFAFGYFFTKVFR